MTTTHTVNLSDTVRNQPHGIILVWKPYINGAADNSGIIYEFIPKHLIVTANGYGHTSFLIKTGFGFGIKYIYVHNNKITGHDGNDDTGTLGGLTFNNALFVLTDVLGI